MTVKYKLFLIPAVFAFLLSSFYIVVAPGKIGNDAAEYDALAESILVGQYSIDGLPSMEREPGYPLFRAAVKLFTQKPEVILWTQAFLYALVIFFIGITISKIDPQAGYWGAWGAALYYGLAYYPSTHLSETFIAFLLSVVGLLLICGIKKPSLKYWFWISIFSGLLILTKYSYILVPFACFLILTVASKKKGIGWKKIIGTIFFSIFIISALVGPWIIRNYITFGEAEVAGRTGPVLYARSILAESSWQSLRDSYFSVLLGRGILFNIYPNNKAIFTEQWGDWWNDKEKVALWGNNPIEINQNRKKAAFEKIFSSSNTIVKFATWSGVEELRLFALPNPLIRAQGGPIEGTFGPLAKEFGLGAKELTLLIFVHIIQLLWFVAIATSFYLGIKKYKYKFVPAIFFICLFLPHLIADNTARYGVPIGPWLLAGIFITILFPLYNKILKNRLKLLFLKNNHYSP